MAQPPEKPKDPVAILGVQGTPVLPGQVQFHHISGSDHKGEISGPLTFVGNRIVPVNDTTADDFVSVIHPMAKSVKPISPKAHVLSTTQTYRTRRQQSINTMSALANGPDDHVPYLPASDRNATTVVNRLYKPYAKKLEEKKRQEYIDEQKEIGRSVPRPMKRSVFNRLYTRSRAVRIADQAEKRQHKGKRSEKKKEGGPPKAQKKWGLKRFLPQTKRNTRRVHPIPRSTAVDTGKPSTQKNVPKQSATQKKIVANKSSRPVSSKRATKSSPKKVAAPIAAKRNTVKKSVSPKKNAAGAAKSPRKRVAQQSTKSLKNTQAKKQASSKLSPKKASPMKNVRKERKVAVPKRQSRRAEPAKKNSQPSSPAKVKQPAKKNSRPSSPAKVRRKAPQTQEKAQPPKSPHKAVVAKKVSQQRPSPTKGPVKKARPSQKKNAAAPAVARSTSSRPASKPVALKGGSKPVALKGGSKPVALRGSGKKSKAPQQQKQQPQSQQQPQPQNRQQQQSSQLKKNPPQADPRPQSAGTAPTGKPKTVPGKFNPKSRFSSKPKVILPRKAKQQPKEDS